MIGLRCQRTARLQVAANLLSKTPRKGRKKHLAVLVMFLFHAESPSSWHARKGSSAEVHICVTQPTIQVLYYPPFLCNGGFPCVIFQKIMQNNENKMAKKLENGGGTPPFFPYTAGGDTNKTLNNYTVAKWPPTAPFFFEKAVSITVGVYRWF